MNTAARTPPAHADRPRSKDSMLISPNLRAALEYDELARAAEGPSAPSSRRPSLTAGAPATAPDAAPAPALGLPPPPRPKSRASLHKSRSPPMTPTSPLTTPDSSPGSAHDAPTNPYINPTPSLAHLYAAVPPPLAPPHAREHSRSLSLPANVIVRRAPADAVVRVAPQSASRVPPGTPPGSAGHGVASPGLEGGVPAARPGFQRHLRYLSSLQKVEKMLVKGKTRAVGRGVDGGRGEEAREGRAGGDGERMAGCGVGMVAVAGRGAGGSLGRRSAGVGALPNEEPAAGMPRLPLRPLISHGRRPSAASTAASEDDEQSHDPPATPSDDRISVSSTLYQDPHDAPYSPPSDLHASSRSPRPAMPDSDRDSFIDLASPTFSPHLIDFASNASHSHHHPYATHAHNVDSSRSRAKPTLPAISTAISHKPPIPTSPKPDFKRRSRSAQPPHKHSRDDTLDSPSGQEITYTRVRPPTTNLLNPVERADRLRSTRKLAQVFGQTPANAEAVAMSHMAYEANAPNALLCAPTTGLVLGGGGGKRGYAQLKHHRGAVSMSVAQGGSEAPQPLWPPPEPDASRYVALSARRHSTPLTPDTFMFMEEDLAAPDRSSLDSDGSRHSSDIIEVSSRRGTPHSDWSSHLGQRSVGPGSPTSFMDLSEEDVLNDGVSSIITVETPKADRRTGLVNSSSASIYSFTSEDLADEERRRKREKLAKLHRFLGSRVPVDVVLQQLSLDSTLHNEDLPPLSEDLPQQQQQHPYARMELDTRKTWVRRRRSSSAGELGHRWLSDDDRLKEELNEKEKAQNVKRAIKMEKMFGVAPPQTLYHTRAAHAPAASTSHGTSASTGSAGPFLAVPQSPGSPTSRNVNQSAYSRNKVKVKRSARPGTADSAEPLIGSHGNGRLGSPQGFSDIYEHYRHSLNSLNDIIDRDDRESLQRLHGIIHGDADAHAPLQEFAREEDSPSPSPPSTPRAERRRSLPTRASVASLASQYSIASVASTVAAPPEESEFQVRRRRAAKLTQFFGVDYRNLVNEVFESLELGLEEERGKGTLHPEEVAELLHKLRKLKTKRNSLFS
ncbi:hypothetical protein PsYK624_023420 [Phanerochaete sordida]|uniref:Uncharacterized protein n=1 Tax=Phanerochaete sordida TaxID=48140 RepID=A0A9P3LA02_9APHY|nr:hypothetical protein PsYK624_023420 [Phanerochaete sordida]